MLLRVRALTLYCTGDAMVRVCGCVRVAVARQLRSGEEGVAANMSTEVGAWVWVLCGLLCY